MSDTTSEPHAEEKPHPSRARTSPLFIVLGLVAAVVLSAAVGLVIWGARLVTDEVKNELLDNETLIARIGRVDSFTMDVVQSGQQDDPDTFVYSVAGAKGRGVVIARHVTNAEGDEEIVWAKLRLPSGETVDLVGSDVPGSAGDEGD